MSERKDNPPPITEPTKRAGHEIEKGLPGLIANWRAVASVMLIAFLMGFGLAWYLVVASKNATIETLTTASTEKDSKIDLLQKDNEKLQRQNVELKAALAEFAAPLKKRTLILAKQLRDFVQQLPNGQAYNDCITEYNYRFPNWNAKIVSQLDEAGQHSETLNKLLDRPSFYDHNSFVTNVLTAARELERLANNLKE
jgi:hypothetical protein